MFWRKKKSNPNEQVPYELYESLHKNPSGRRGRWVFEVVVATLIVLILVLGGIWLYKFVHAAKAPVPAQSTDVTQPPQSTQKNPNQTNSSAASVSNATNTQGVSNPSN
jgi:cytoskeletal protein RodZ